jgi:hypothetical protein
MRIDREGKIEENVVRVLPPPNQHRKGLCGSLTLIKVVKAGDASGFSRTVSCGNLGVLKVKMDFNLVLRLAANDGDLRRGHIWGERRA